MEEKKKNKIFIVSSCVVASLVIALVIALMPQMQLKANRNVYQDEMENQDISSCVSTCIATGGTQAGCIAECNGSSGNATTAPTTTTPTTPNPTSVVTPVTTATATNEISSCMTECISKGGNTTSCLEECNPSYPGTTTTPNPTSVATPVTTATATNEISSCMTECISKGGNTTSCLEECNPSYPGATATPTSSSEPEKVRKRCFSWTGQTCTGTPIYTNNGVCPDGMFETANECNSYGSGKITCYQKSGNSCSEQVYERVTTCPEGSFPSKETCNAGVNNVTCHYWDGTQCVTEVLSRASCPSGYYSSPNECSTKKKVNDAEVPEVKCAAGEGYSVSEGCYTCPAGTYSNAGDNACHLCMETGYTSDRGSNECNKCSDGFDMNDEGLCVSKADCTLVGVASTSKNTSIDENAKNDDYYIAVITTAGNCEGVSIPCNVNNGTPKEATLTGKAGVNKYECIVYPDFPCIPSTVSSKIGETKKDYKVDKIKPDWNKTPEYVCDNDPPYKGFLEADKAAVDVYWDNYGQCPDGSYGYREKYRRNLDCESGGTNIIITNPQKACYADTNNLKTAKNVEWLTASEAYKKGLTNRITLGVDSKTEITEANHLQQCKKPDVKNGDKYCYANNEDIDKATQTVMLTVEAYNEKMKDNSFKLRYQIKDSNGNALTDADACIASACYIENNTTNYKWAPNGTLDTGKYTKVAIYNKDDCNFVEMCMAKPGKDDFEEVSWVKSKSNIDAKIKEGWVEISGIDSEAQCNPGACYQKNSEPTEFVWFSTGQDHTGYTKVDSSKCEAPSPEPYTSPACYVHSLNNGTVKYEWGDYSNQIGYTKINIKEEYCISSNNCYLYTKDGTYHNGDYSLNDDYIMVDDVNCKKIQAPRTSIDKSTVMYVAMLCLALAGVGLTYYGNLKRKKY